MKVRAYHDVTRGSGNDRNKSPEVWSSQENRPVLPPAIEQHLREMDHHRAFLVGQRDNTPRRREDMTKYLEEWEQKWAGMLGGKKAKGTSP